jgi:hypothetical protein
MSSRFLRAVVVGLFAVPAFAQPEKADRKAEIAQLLDKKVLLTADDLKEISLVELLPKVSKQHSITFVVMEEQFRAKNIRDIRVQTSPLKKFDPSGLTVRQFLTAWLGSINATYRANADYVEIIPLTAVAELGAQALPLPADGFEALLAKLHRDEMVPLGGNVNEIPLFEIVQQMAVKNDIPFVINEEGFRAIGVQDIKTKTVNLSASQLRGQTVHQFLTTILDNLGATYLIKGKTIEIVTPDHAIRVTKAAANHDESGRKVLREPLVCAAFTETPLEEAVAMLAKRFDLTAIVSPQAGDARMGLITARLLNVPADRALDLVALQADLRVVRKGAAFLITSREHADALFQEETEKQRARIELEKFRQMPPPRPEAPAPHPKPDQTVFLKFDLGPQLKPQK